MAKIKRKNHQVVKKTNITTIQSTTHYKEGAKDKTIILGTKRARVTRTRELENRTYY